MCIMLYIILYEILHYMKYILMTINRTFLDGKKMPVSNRILHSRSQYRNYANYGTFLLHLVEHQGQVTVGRP